MLIKVLSKAEAKSFVPPTPFVNICIVCLDDDEPELIDSDQRIDALYLRFDDIEPPDVAHNGYSEEQLFTEQHASDILAFVDAYRSIYPDMTVLVSCCGGVSRSSATAAALGLIYNQDDKFVFSSKTLAPNMHVYRTILNVYTEETGEIPRNKE